MTVGTINLSNSNLNCNFLRFWNALLSMMYGRLFAEETDKNDYLDWRKTFFVC